MDTINILNIDNVNYEIEDKVARELIPQKKDLLLEITPNNIGNVQYSIQNKNIYKYFEIKYLYYYGDPSNRTGVIRLYPNAEALMDWENITTSNSSPLIQITSRKIIHKNT